MSVLIDANIFVYAYDPADPDKHEKALRLIEEVTRRGDLVLSVQVVNELAWTLLRRGLDFGLGAEDVRDIIDEVIQSARVVPGGSSVTGVTRNLLSTPTRNSLLAERPPRGRGV